MGPEDGYGGAGRSGQEGGSNLLGEQVARGGGEESVGGEGVKGSG